MFYRRRFVINVPEEESRDPIRLLFQVELAHWFYLDFYCPENSGLRSCSIKEFAIQDILCGSESCATCFRQNMFLCGLIAIMDLEMHR